MIQSSHLGAEGKITQHHVMYSWFCKQILDTSFLFAFLYWENYCHVHYYTYPKQTQRFKANMKSDIRFDQAAFIKFLSKKKEEITKSEKQKS